MSDRAIIAAFAALTVVLVAVIFVYGSQKTAVEPTTSELVNRVCAQLGGVGRIETDKGQLTIICREKP